MVEVFDETTEPGLRTVSMLRVERRLDVEPLDHRLDDPVAIGEQAEMVLDIAGA